jgi:signal transduction histidine kinase
MRQGTSESGDECVSVSVCDEGPGIPPDELEAVFDKFVQSTKTKTGAGGTGLGLPIAREIVAAHKGRVWAVNRPDRGTEFRVDIPIGVPTAERNERMVA